MFPSVIFTRSKYKYISDENGEGFQPLEAHSGTILRMGRSLYNRSVRICSHGTSDDIVEMSYDSRIIQELSSFLDRAMKFKSHMNKKFSVHAGMCSEALTPSRWIQKPAVEMIGNHLSVNGAGQLADLLFHDHRTATRRVAPVMLSFIYFI